MMKWPRVTVRRLMIVVLVVGGGLGWLAHTIRDARIQREAVEVVRQAGGTVLYDWQFDRDEVRVKPGTSIISDEVPGWPKWLVDRLGVDYFGHVRDITFRRSSRVRSADEANVILSRVARIRGLKHLSFLNFPLDDRALASLEESSSLESLMLRGCGKVSDEGMLHVGKLGQLEQLFLENTKVSDAGLLHLQGLTRLKVLNLGGTRVTNAGLVHLEAFKDLGTLGLDGTSVGGLKLAAFLKGRTRMKGLYLKSTAVTDPDLASLESMGQLGWLGLRDDAITDAGLSSLKRLKNLQSLDLYGTKVSRAGVADLQSSLKSTRIESDAP